MAICGKSMEVLETTLGKVCIWRVLLVLFQQQPEQLFFFFSASGFKSLPRGVTRVSREKWSNHLEVQSFFMNRRNSLREELYFYPWIFDTQKLYNSNQTNAHQSFWNFFQTFG